MCGAGGGGIVRTAGLGFSAKALLGEETRPMESGFTGEFSRVPPPRNDPWPDRSVDAPGGHCRCGDGDRDIPADSSRDSTRRRFDWSSRDVYSDAVELGVRIIGGSGFATKFTRLEGGSSLVLVTGAGGSATGWTAYGEFGMGAGLGSFRFKCVSLIVGFCCRESSPCSQGLRCELPPSSLPPPADICGIRESKCK